ncbi:PREDICTED: protocadherin beta-16-like, partial [Gekko japonicus]|uniref:Protocadherin beta-16-like n=1 Tax=Gekko japonicus TaxID=146911 RepID=A0ABM1JXK9_GEKJA
MDDTFRIMKGLSLLFLLSLSGVVCVSIRYSLPEEKKSGSLVANVLKDLKLGPGELSARRAQLVSKSKKQYFQLDNRSGNLFINDKIDREALCGKMDSCLVLFEIVLQNPLKIYNMETEIDDVNDNTPAFSQNEFMFDISEHVPTNTRFPLESARDADLGENSIQNYTLSPNAYFRLDVQSDEFGSKYVDLVLEKPLDREKEAHVGLTLTAVDGGVPQRTGTVLIKVSVLDSNDNFPQFTQSEYKVKLKENSPRGTPVYKVEARDLDFGSNAQISYSFHRVPDQIHHLFNLNQSTGEITVLGPIDYEEESSYDMNVKATDGGGLSGVCKVLVLVEDENDNVPEVVVVSHTSALPEDSALDVLVVLFSVTDRDSGDNGRTSCSIEAGLPFGLKPSDNNYYQLVTQKPLDWERDSEYNVTITATDWGSPRLSSFTIINVQISDINDNSPVFEKSLYHMQLRENNIPGLLIGLVQAKDLDMEQNAKVTYSLLPGKVSDQPVSSYVSINSETGNLYAIRSVDYEQVKDFQVTVRAVDSGSPPLSSEVMVRVLIVDENDNAPFILYPLQNGTSPSNDLVPRGAEAGYLVTKVVAVDRDSGQNSWLTYELLKATEPGLFSVETHNGEVRTTRVVTSQDAFKQRLLIVVKDNGEAPQSSTSSLSILLVDGFSDSHMQIADLPPEEEQNDSLTLYLIISLCFISFLFLFSVLTVIVIWIHKRRNYQKGSHVSSGNFYCDADFVPNSSGPNGSGTLSRPNYYEVFLTAGYGTNEFKVLSPLLPSLAVDLKAPMASSNDPQPSKGTITEITDSRLVTVVERAMKSHPTYGQEAFRGDLLNQLMKDDPSTVKGAETLMLGEMLTLPQNFG